MTQAQIKLGVAKLHEPHQRWEIYDEIFVGAKPPYNQRVGYRYPAHSGWIDCHPYDTSRDAIIQVIIKWCDANDQWNAFVENLWDHMGITSDWSEQEAWKALFKLPVIDLSVALLKTSGDWK